MLAALEAAWEDLAARQDELLELHCSGVEGDPNRDSLARHLADLVLTELLSRGHWQA